MTVSGGRREGFTLLEILVALVLVSVLTLIAGLALRLTISAWERGEHEGEGAQVRAMVPSLLENQLKYIMISASFSPTGGEVPLPFYGTKHSLSFFTSYAPMASTFQGLLHVYYVFVQDDKTLLCYQQLITNQKDFEDSLNLPAQNERKGTPPESTIRGIDVFDLLYGSGNTTDFDRMDQWKEEWNEKQIIPPAYIRLEFAEGEKEKPRRWFFAVGH
jgi:prepilin-type N-terminal cleavage/methylation domain-containing protein